MRYPTGQAFVECCLGFKILDIKSSSLIYLNVSLDVIYFHVACNNLRHRFSGGPGYNGVIQRMADLLYTSRTQFPHSAITINSVLSRKDIGYFALFTWTLI